MVLAAIAVVAVGALGAMEWRTLRKDRRTVAGGGAPNSVRGNQHTNALASEATQRVTNSQHGQAGAGPL